MNYLEEFHVQQLSVTTHRHGLVSKTSSPE